MFYTAIGPAFWTFLLICSNQFYIRLSSFIVSTNNLTFTLVKGKQSTMTWTTNIWPDQPWPRNPAPSVIMVWSCIPKKIYMVHKYNIETRFRGKLIVFFNTYMYEQIYWQFLRSWRSHLLSSAILCSHYRPNQPLNKGGDLTWHMIERSALDAVRVKGLHQTITIL